MAKLHTSFFVAMVLSLLASSHARFPFFSFNYPENLASSPLPSETWFQPDADLIPTDNQPFALDATPIDYPQSQTTEPDVVLIDELELVITHRITVRSVNRYNHHQINMMMKQQPGWSSFPPRHGKHLVGPREVPYSNVEEEDGDGEEEPIEQEELENPGASFLAGDESLTPMKK